MLSNATEVSLSKFMTKLLRHTQSSMALFWILRMVPVHWTICCPYL